MEDVRAAALKLRSLGLRVAALLGHSKAGTVVVLYTAKYGARLHLRASSRLWHRPGVTPSSAAQGTSRA